jgi:hypothetical protein
MAVVLVLGYISGWMIAVCAIRVRAGVGVSDRLKVFGPNGFGLAWTLHSALKAVFWPLTLIHWLASGCLEPRVVFNEKAHQRLARRAAVGGVIS